MRKLKNNHHFFSSLDFSLFDSISEIMKPLEEDGPVPKRRRIQKNSESVTISMEDLNLPNLPNEIWIKILEYLSTKDILRNMAPVSRRFHQISQDPFLIKRIELKSNQEFEFWSRLKEINYFSDFFKVLKRSEKLTCLSLDLNFIGQVYQIENIFEKLPFLVKHPQHLEEFCLLNSSCDLKQFQGKVLKLPPDETTVNVCKNLSVFLSTDMERLNLMETQEKELSRL